MLIFEIIKTNTPIPKKGLAPILIDLSHIYVVSVLSLRSGVSHGFCDRALKLPSCTVFYVIVRLRVCSSRRSLICVPCFVLERGVRIPALMSWVSVSCRGLDTRAPCSVSFSGIPVLSSRVLCFMLLHAVRVLSVACIHVMYCAVCLCFSWAACSHVVMSCVNTWLMSILISCISSCPILHMACDFVLLAMCFFCVWAHGICLSALMLIVLALPCLALPCLALPCLALPCPALPCLALSCFSSTG